MGKHWRQTITVTGFDDEEGYALYCEPEGAEHQVLPGDVLTVIFTASKPHDFDISRVSGGLVPCRLGDSEVSIHDKRGRQLSWWDRTRQSAPASPSTRHTERIM